MKLELIEKTDSFTLNGNVGKDSIMDGIGQQYFVKPLKNVSVEGDFGIYNSWGRPLFDAWTQEKAMDCAYGVLAIETNALLEKYPNVVVKEEIKKGRESKLIGKHIETSNF